jgi:hypothetical protein
MTTADLQMILDKLDTMDRTCSPPDYEQMRLLMEICMAAGQMYFSYLMKTVEEVDTGTRDD